MKKILGVYEGPPSHWVGDGFPVKTLFTYNNHGKKFSPFLLLDYASPTNFAPNSEKRRGVDQHPHRGFETVTIVYKGELAHRDSTGESGIIGPGDVQWMTAGAGILHEEFHSDAFNQSGGILHMVQLWVNLPAKDKMTPPHYQSLRKQDIPIVDLPKDSGKLRVIAGEFQGHSGPAHTYTPINLWDMQLTKNSRNDFSLPEGWTLILIILQGSVRINETVIVNEGEIIHLDNANKHFSIEAQNDASLLLLNGEPIDEPVVGYGPFVMNNHNEIKQAINDLNNGQFGKFKD